MSIRSVLRAAAWSMACCLIMAGCGPATEELTPVKGRVLYRGRPIQGGTVVFIPDPSHGSHGNLAVGDIQPDGSFMLKTHDVLGAVVGHHKVTVSWVQSAPGYIPQSLLPAKYRDPGQSGVEVDVVANKTNAVDIDLQ